MNLFFICFTKTGGTLCEELIDCCKMDGMVCEGFSTKRIDSLKTVSSVYEFTKMAFSNGDGVIFIGACGIAVRAIAPFLEHKGKDPAVVVLDEKGKYVISLLSGHMGGANSLAKKLAKYTQGIPVITTATDVQNKIAVDVWAKEQDLWFSDFQMAKKISSKVLENQEIGICSRFPIHLIPEEFIPEKQGKLGICITLDEEDTPFLETLVLIPRIIVLGIGCRKGVSFVVLEKFVLDSLEEQHISPYAVLSVCSIDLKAKEPAILALCEKYKWEFTTYSAEELQKVQGSFSTSDFVKKMVGVDNVCERSALKGSQCGCFIQKKKAKDGMTLAIAMKNWSVGFEE